MIRKSDMSKLHKLIRKWAPAAALLGSLPFATLANAADVVPEPVDTNSTALWIGIAGQDGAWGLHAGGVWAANGDLGASGLLFRGQVLYVDWESEDDDTEGELARINGSIGFQLGGDGFTASAFAGLDYQDVDVDPSNNSDLDDEFGLILTARLAHDGDTQVPLSLEGTYSTANDTYWARARAGYRFDWIDIGPEFAVLGDTGFDAIRIGGYAAVGVSDGVIVELNGGYHDADGSSHGGGSEDGVYGGATLVFVF
jgi:hypothetical protein